MSFSQMDDFTYKHSSQVTPLYTAYTTAQIKANFDSRGVELRTFIMGLVSSLNSLDAAGNIGSTPIASGSGSTVRDQLVWLLGQIAATSTGSIADGSLGEIKLAPDLLAKINNALSNEGLLSLLETTDKSSLVNAINEIFDGFTLHKADNSKQIPHLGITSNSGDTYSITTTETIEINQKFTIKINAASTSAPTLAINGGTAYAIKKPNGNNAKLYIAPYDLFFDGSAFILLGEGGEYGTAGQPQTLEGYTLGTETGVVNGSMPNNGAVTITPGTSNQTIAQGYHNGSGYVAGDSDLIASNIVSTANIFNVQGTAPAPLTFYVGDSVIADSKNENFTTSDNWVKVASFKMRGSGTVRFKWSFNDASTNTSSTRVYKNGVAVGTIHSTNNTQVAISEDYAVTTNDTLELWCQSTSLSSCSMTNISICGSSNMVGVMLQN